MRDRDRVANNGWLLTCGFVGPRGAVARSDDVQDVESEEMEVEDEEEEEEEPVTVPDLNGDDDGVMNKTLVQSSTI